MMNNTHPRVSIGMPVYNGAEYIREAIDSILAQTFTNFELIISDNASTDDTEEICRSYVAKDPRISYYRNEQNMGATWNMSRVVELARGEYFKWAHHDDTCAPTFLERCVEVLDREPSVILCYPRTHIIDEHSRIFENYADELNLRSPKSYERFREFLKRPGLSNAAHGLFRLSELRQTALIADVAYSDRNLLGETALRGEIYEWPEYLFLKRSHPNTSTRLYTDDYKLMAFHNPQKRNKIIFPKWTRFIAYFQAMNRAHLNFYERLRCTIYLAQYLVVPKRVFGLLDELLVAAKLTPSALSRNNK